MQPHGYPFLLSPLYTQSRKGGSTHDPSAYGAHPNGAGGSGYLMYDTSASRWTAVYGGFWIDHTGGCMMSYDDSSAQDEKDPTAGGITVPGVAVRPRGGNTNDWNL